MLGPPTHPETLNTDPIHSSGVSVTPEMVPCSPATDWVSANPQTTPMEVVGNSGNVLAAMGAQFPVPNVLTPVSLDGFFVQYGG